MSFNIRNYVSDDHIESIGEIAKSQSAIIQALSLDNSKLEAKLQEKDKEIERLNKRIKELEEGFKASTEDLCEESTKIEKAIEYIKQKEINVFYQELGLQQMNAKQELLEILQGSDE